MLARDFDFDVARYIGQIMTGKDCKKVELKKNHLEWLELPVQDKLDTAFKLLSYTEPRLKHVDATVGGEGSAITMSIGEGAPTHIPPEMQLVWNAYRAAKAEGKEPFADVDIEKLKTVNGNGAADGE